jgi:hypothetical protein
VQTEQALAYQLHEELKNFQQQRQGDENRRRPVDALMAKHLQAAEEKLNELRAQMPTQ